VMRGTAFGQRVGAGASVYGMQIEMHNAIIVRLIVCVCTFITTLT
jgi:hypothetical protein